MLKQTGNIWEFYHEIRWIVIATNIGWKKDETNPMGAGIAKQASEMFPELPKWYGKRCKKYGIKTALAPYYPARFFLFPTKPLDEERPWMSWQNMSTIELIIKSAKQLSVCVDVLSKNNFISKVGVPMVGCENGGLKQRDVLSVLSNILDNRFVIFCKD